MKSDIIIFKNQEVELDVNIKDDTVWLTQSQIAKLFDKDSKTITRHIQNIFLDEELDEKSIFKYLATIKISLSLNI